MELAGFSISPAERLRVLKVLESTGQSNLKSPEKLKFLLAPVLVQGRAEQERFYELFDRYWEEVQQPWEMPEPEAVAERFWPNWLRWALVVLVLGGLTWAAIELGQRENPPAPKVYFEHSPEVAVGDTIQFDNLSAHIDSSAIRWEIVHPTTGQIEHVDSQSFDLNYVVKEAGENPDREVRLTCLKSIDTKTGQPVSHVSTFHIKCTNPPKIDTILAQPEIKINGTARFEAKLSDVKDVQLAWDFGDSTTATGSKVSHQFTKSGLFEVRLTATRTGLDGDCKATKIHRISVGRDKAYLAAKILIRDQVDSIVNFSLGTWILLGLLALAIIWFWIKWARRKPPPLPDEGEGDLTAVAERFKAVDKGPYFIPFRPQEAYVRMEPSFYRLADVLRQRQEGLRKNMDVPASVKKTIAEGGFPNLLSRADAVPTEYLFLIDEQTAGSHLSKLYAFLVDFLRKREVLGEAFYFKTEPIRFWNGQHPAGITPDQLYRLFPNNRLIVLGDGHGLLDPHPAKQNAPSLRSDAAGFFRHWKQRMLLTPMPVVSWTYREGALHSLFAIFPSDTEGLGEAIKFLERGMDGEDLPTYASWCERLLEGRLETDLNYRRWRTAADHRDYLQAHPTLYAWVCALAVYPKPDWNITLAIGRALSPLGVEVNYDNLLIVSRIPWLLSGDLSPRLRRELLNDLDPEAERLAREAVQAELQAVEALVQGSHANQEHQINLALQNFAIAPDSPETQSTLRQLIALDLLMPKQLAELNQNVERHVGQRQQGFGQMNQMAQQANQSNFAPQAPDIQQFLEENKPKPAPLDKPFFTKDFWWANAATLAFLFIFLLVWKYSGTEQLTKWTKPPYTLGGCEERYLYAYLLKKECVADSAVLYNNAGVEALLDFNGTDIGSLPFNEVQKISSLIASEKNFQRALVLRPDYQLAKNNLGATYFNTAKIMYDWALEEFDDPSGVPLSPNILWDNVLPAFRLALPFDRVRVDAMHGLGLVHFYAGRQDSALVYYNAIQRTDSLFFDTMKTYPNLKSLLENRIKDYPIRPKLQKEIKLLDTDKPIVLSAAVRKPVYKNCPKGNKLSEEKCTADKIENYIQNRIDYPREALEKLIQGIVTVGFVVERDGSISNVRALNDIGGGCAAEAVRLIKGLPKFKPGLNAKGDAIRVAYSLPIKFALDVFKEPEMVFVKGGTFQMGCDEKRDGDCKEDELPVHDVTLSDFSIGKYEVTNEEYAAFLNEYGLTKVKAGPNKGELIIEEHEWGIAFRSQGDISTAYYEPQKGYEKYPVINVSWYGAVTYTEWLSQKTGKNYRLPTEAEWEYAARGGSQSNGYRFSGSNDKDKVAWFDSNSGYRTHAVGGKAKNELGIFDMSGNVWENCSDWYDGTYYKNFVKVGTNNPQGPSSGVEGSSSGDGRVARGGSWDGSDFNYRTANREGIGRSSNFGDNIGFRLAREEYRASGK